MWEGRWGGATSGPTCRFNPPGRMCGRMCGRSFRGCRRLVGGDSAVDSVTAHLDLDLTSALAHPHHELMGVEWGGGSPSAHPPLT